MLFFKAQLFRTAFIFVESKKNRLQEMISGLSLLAKADQTMAYE